SLNDRFNSVSSDSSSFIPSSSSSTSSLNNNNSKNKREKGHRNDISETIPLNAPSTSSGISRGHRKKHKSRPAKQPFLQMSEASSKFLQDELNRLEGTVHANHLKHIMSHYCRQVMQHNFEQENRLTSVHDTCHPLSRQCLNYD